MAADKDICPELIQDVNRQFQKNCLKDVEMKKLSEKAQNGTATYADAYRYAESVGSARADAFKAQISSEVLPDGRMYYNIAERLMTDSLTADHDMVATYAEEVQKAINENAGIHLKAQRADVDKDRIDGFVQRLAREENYDDVSWLLNEPVRVHARSVVDDTIRKNAEFHHKAGIKAQVKRDAASDCCKWCDSLVGDYTYPGVPREVFARHDNCRCTLDYNGRRLTAYESKGGKNNTFRDQGEQEKIEARKELARQIDNNAMKWNSQTTWHGKPQFHTKKEIDELTRYASDRGIVLDSSFRSFDGDIGLIKDFVNRLDENINRSQHMRKDSARLGVSYSMDDSTFAITKKTSITINGYAYRDVNQLSDEFNKKVQEGWFTYGSTYANIADHESAHVIVHLDQLKVKGVYEYAFGKDKVEATRLVLENISEYGLEKEGELIAESYVKYKNGLDNEYVLRVLSYCGIL